MSGSACGLRRLFAGSGLSVLVDFSGLIRVSLWCRRRPILLLCVVKRAPEDITTSVGGGESLAGLCRWGWYFQLGPTLIRVPQIFFGNDQSFELGLGFLCVDLCSLTPNIGLDKSQLTFYGSRWRQLTLRFLGLCLGS
ncbi:hypothetical protein F2Q68_00016392 [Brassica cretica]|uniref:Uncharacterized protein n=1 Tax=Brassica cretica TaxID=69181 RepID=A0A8S9HKM0_BRACR|nr:hypothetical protein F2Q68_00016392 [Brassica cretica]